MPGGILWRRMTWETRAMNELRLLGQIGLVGALALAVGCRASQPDSRPATTGDTQTVVQAPGDPLHPKVKLETTLGDIVCELNAERAPAAVLNFVQYVNANYYDGTIFHRVLKDSMIQGGGYTPDLEPKLRGLKPDVEGSWGSHLQNERGTISMIRGRGTAQLASAQFYINLADNVDLDESRHHGSYAVFGRVVEGMDTVDEIGNVPVGSHEKYAGGRSEVVPTRPIIIKSVRLITPFDTFQVQAMAAATRVDRQSQLNELFAELEEKAGSTGTIAQSGLRYVDFAVGDGESPELTDTVVFQYRGTLIDGTEFESTYATGPTERKIGGLITGLQEGLITMNEGGRRTLILPPELGFGASGVPGIIPPDAVLIFEIELLEIK